MVLFVFSLGFGFFQSNAPSLEKRGAALDETGASRQVLRPDWPTSSEGYSTLYIQGDPSALDQAKAGGARRKQAQAQTILARIDLLWQVCRVSAWFGV